MAARMRPEYRDLAGIGCTVTAQSKDNLRLVEESKDVAEVCDDEIVSSVFP